MQIKDIPTYVVEIHTSPGCDVDKCTFDAEYYYHNSAADPDAFQVWNLCATHSLELDKRIAQSKEFKYAR